MAPITSENNIYKDKQSPACHGASQKRQEEGHYEPGL